MWGQGETIDDGFERGAALTEFAILFPLLVYLLVGIVEFGFVFSQELDMRNTVREGARLGAVNHPEGSDPPVLVRTDANRSALLGVTCDEFSLAGPATVAFTSPGSPGDTVTVVGNAPVRTLTGLIDWALPASYEVNSTAAIRAEQDATWANTDLVAFPDGEPCP